MINLAMERKMKKGECIDVRTIGEDLGEGRFKLRSFDEDKDYCDAEYEQWIWSIGKHLTTGDIIASYSAEFYQNPEYECLWLR